MHNEATGYTWLTQLFGPVCVKPLPGREGSMRETKVHLV